MRSHPTLLAVGGPTASGKTELAISLAEVLGGEIVNADSRQVYRGMDTGTAKPTVAQRARVPHHLIDIADPDQPFSLGLYVRLAHEAIRAIQGRGRLPILTGGTGLYLRAITQGYEVPEIAADLELRGQLESEIARGGLPALVERLRALDPEGAVALDTKNPRRVIRALEVSLATGKPFSATQRRDPRYRSLVLLLEGENDVLFPRADARLDRMLAEGFAGEVTRLLAAGYGPNLPAFSALGYRELARATGGECSLGDAVEGIRRATRAFIRRQRTWFRAEPEANRLDITQPDLLERALALIRAEWAYR
ncbi:MAG: tRNA (adenosine(37)-N6)-dimethylallyltransferase MiaA [Chloroflexota bacterium]